MIFLTIFVWCQPLVWTLPLPHNGKNGLHAYTISALPIYMNPYQHRIHPGVYTIIPQQMRSINVL